MVALVGQRDRIGNDVVGVRDPVATVAFVDDPPPLIHPPAIMERRHGRIGDIARAALVADPDRCSREDQAMRRRRSFGAEERIRRPAGEGPEAGGPAGEQQPLSRQQAADDRAIH